jgi:hypothetical protein
VTPAIEAAFAATLRRLSAGWAGDFAAPRPVVGPEYDPLAQLPPPGQWSALQHQLFGALRLIRPRYKLAVLTMMCNDAPYIAEFIAHHLAVGVERIFVYTNNNTDSSLAVLRWFEANGLVTVLPMVTQGDIHIQRKNYHHALFLLPELRLYEWVAVIDSDEFLLPDARHDHHLPTMLGAAPADVEAIVFPWHWRLGAVTFEPSPGLLAERFAHANHWDHGKSVMRLRHVWSLAMLHYPLFTGDFPLHDTLFNRIERDDGRPDRQCTGAGGWAEHFWAKSFAEFVLKKRRGDAAELGAETAFRRGYEHFFAWSQPCTPGNYAPWPEVVLARTRAWLARFASRPGYAALQERWQAAFAAHVAAVRADPELCSIYAQMLPRAARGP